MISRNEEGRLEYKGELPVIGDKFDIEGEILEFEGMEAWRGKFASPIYTKHVKMVLSENIQQVDLYGSD